jgi:hypothetical protein
MARRCALNSNGYMTLRTVALVGSLILLGLLVLGCFYSLEFLPITLMVATLSIALGLERRHYGLAQRDRPGPEWQKTEEQFLDDVSGRLVQVWYNPKTGERRYVDGG